MTLVDVAYIPGFMSNLVSLSRLVTKGVHWNTQEGYLTREGKPIAYIQQIKGHWSLSQQSLSDEALVTAAIATVQESSSTQDLSTQDSSTQDSSTQDSSTQDSSTQEFTTQESQAIPSGVSKDIPTSLATATQTLENRDTELTQLWHNRLGHLGIDALRHLQRSTEGMDTFIVDAASVSHCETCRLAKATQQISRSSDKEH